MRPSSGRSNPAIIRNVVVLPEPDGPSIVKNSPRAMSRSTPSTAATSPYRFRTPTMRMSMSAAALAIDGRERLLEQGQSVLQLLVGDRQRREQPDHVAVETAREQEQAALEGRVDDRL